MPQPAPEAESRWLPGQGARGLEFHRGEGAWLEDSRGDRYLDLMGMVAVASTGHAHPRVVSAIQEQSARLLTCGASFHNPERTALLDQLRRCWPSMGQGFLVNSGTEAIEAALKIAVDQTGRTRFASIEGGFHGRTLGALALTPRASLRKGFEGLLPKVRHLPANDLNALDAQLDDSIAALFVEAIQGEGGIRELDVDWLRAAATRCRERGIMLVADEIQCGMGRTGTFLAIEVAEVRPDLVTLAKGLGSGVPIGALLIGAHLRSPSPGLLGSTFGGGPLACAAARATLEIIDSQALIERARQLGEIAEEALRPLVGGPLRALRGRGAMLGLEMRRRAGPAVAELQRRKILVTTAGPQVLRLLPPLVIAEDDWRGALHSLIEVLQP